ncbi:uncharacterized protein VTP21DRAFT_4923 [Calcarisporiella thermophila]|uniref:uncharacterized protein n=1 Tax=Calcarisporiella thermophila TaxID=911321 RepID=UPI003743B24F
MNWTHPCLFKEAFHFPRRVPPPAPRQSARPARREQQAGRRSKALQMTLFLARRTGGRSACVTTLIVFRSQTWWPSKNAAALSPNPNAGSSPRPLHASKAAVFGGADGLGHINASTQSTRGAERKE